MTPTELSKKFRADQIDVANRAARRLLGAFAALNFTNLDATAAPWLADVESIAVQAHAESVELGAGMYLDSRKAVGLNGNVAIDTPLLDRAALQGGLVLTGPYAAKKAMSQGGRISDIAERVFTNTSGLTLRDVLNGGRNTIQATAGSDPVCYGYQRVTSSSPCEFCAMLAGNTYNSVESASTVSGVRKRAKNPQPPKSRYHSHCRCTVVPIFGSASFPDGMRKQASEYRDLYNEVSRSGGTEKEKARRFFEAYNAQYKTS